MTATRAQIALLAGTAVAVIVAIAVVLLGSGGGHYTIRAEFTNAEGLFSGSRVMVGGVPVGSVSKITIGPDGLPLVAMKLTDSCRLRTGARADIRLLSNSGELNRVIELSTGHGAALPAGTVIPARRTASPVEIDQVLGTLSPAARSDLSGVIGSLDDSSSGLAGAYRASLQNSAAAFTQAASLLRSITLDGSSLRAFVANGDSAMAAFAHNRTALGNTVDQLSGLLTDTARSQADIRAAVQTLPAGLRGPRTVLDGLADATPTLRGLLHALTPALKQLRPTSEAAVPALHAAAPLLADLSSTLRSAPRQLTAVRGLLRTVRPFAAQLGRVSGALLPILDETRVYTPETAGFLTSWAEVGSGFDNSGHAMRLVPSMAPIPNTTVAADSQSAGYLDPPFIRPPGTLVGQPWSDYTGGFLSKRWPH